MIARNGLELAVYGFTIFCKTVQRKSFGFCLLWKKCVKRTNYINSCSLAYLSHFLTMTSILSKETRKERDMESKDCNPFPGVFLATGEMSSMPWSFLCQDGRRGQHHLVARQGSAAQLLPGGTLLRAALTFGFLGSSSPLCWGLWEMQYLRSLLPDPSPTLFLLLFWFPGTTWRNVCLAWLATHTHCGFCCRGLPAVPQLWTTYARPDLKT